MSAHSLENAVGVKYKVQNISNVQLDLVMIDFQYFNVNGKYEKGETVYLRNIVAGETLNLQAPDNSKAAKVKYKVSMISSEQNGLYVIAE